MASAPLFRAVTKGSTKGSEKGTLTTLWNNKKSQKDKPSEEIDLVDDPPVLQEAAEPMEEVNGNGEIMEVTPEAPAAVEADPGPGETMQSSVEATKEVQEPAPVTQQEQDQQGEKKRKRPAKTAEQVAALEIFYSKDAYPTADAKKECAASTGLEVDQVSKWLEGRRKQARADGTLPAKRSRASKGADEAQPPQAAEPVSAPAAEQQQQQQQVPEEEKPACPPAVEEESQPMELDTNATENEPSAVPEVVVLEPASKGPALAPVPAAAEEEMTTIITNTDTQTPVEPTATAPIAATQATQKTEKSSKAPAPTLPSLEERTKLVGELAVEAGILRERGLASPLLDLATALPAPFSDDRLSALIVGQTLPLSALVTVLLPLFTAAEGSDTAPTQDALRCRVIDVATRKAHDPLDLPAKGALALDALEAVPSATRPCMWQWELRDFKTLPKGYRLKANLIKRRATRVGERLTAVTNAHQALSGLEQGLSTAVKTARALESLKKAKTLEVVEAEIAAELAAAEAKQSKVSMTVEERQRQAAEKEAEKERVRKEKEAEKEKARKDKEEERARAAAEKEEERAKAAAEKEAEKERIRKEKEAEKETKVKEAEASKLAKKTGFKDPEALNKTANKFMNFFKATGPPKSGSTPQAGNTPATASSKDATGPSPANPVSAFSRRFPKPPSDLLALPPTQPLVEDAVDAALGASVTPEQTAAEWRVSLARVAADRAASRAGPPSTIGIPPSWARGPGSLEAAEHRLRQLRDSGVDPSAVRTWRRKFIFFPADSKRPAYYGSWPAPGPEVGPRRPLGRDETLDYEIMSDLEWEEEPEGSSLSGADSASEGGVVEESEVENSFMVADGYLSEDEGVRLEDELEAESAEPMEVDAVGGGGGIGAQGISGAQGGDWSMRERKAAALQVQMDRARRVGKPLVVMRDGCVNDGGADAGGNAILGDPSLLEALAMEVLQPRVSFMPPEDPATAAAVDGGVAAAPGSGNRPTPAAGTGAAAAAAGGATGAGGSTAAAALAGGRPKQERPDDLLPALAAFVQANAKFAKAKLIEGFKTAYPDRKMTNKWVGDKISSVAEYSGNCWKMRTAPVAMPVAPGAAAAAALPVNATPSAAGAAQRATGPLDRILVPQSMPMSTPAVPSALRNLGPPSLVKAPERLVTTTAAGQQQPVAITRGESATLPKQRSLVPLQVPIVAGTGDAWWQEVVKHIDADIELEGSASAPSFRPAFEPSALETYAAMVPATVLSVLLAALGRCIETRPTAAPGVANCLRNAVETVANAEAGGEFTTLSQKAWSEPLGQPVAASIGELCREPELLSILTKCLGAGCAADCLAIVTVLVASDAAKEALKEATEEDKEALRAELKALNTGNTNEQVAALVSWLAGL